MTTSPENVIASLVEADPGRTVTAYMAAAYTHGMPPAVFNAAWAEMVTADQVALIHQPTGTRVYRLCPST